MIDPMRLGPEWRGRLLPECAEDIAASLKGWRNSGLVSGVQLLGGGPECQLSATLEGIIFPLDEPPQLPIEGCGRSPCCDCTFIPVLTGEGDDARQARTPLQIEGPDNTRAPE